MWSEEVTVIVRSHHRAGAHGKYEDKRRRGLTRGRVVQASLCRSEQSHASANWAKLQQRRAKQRYMTMARQARDWKDTHTVLKYYSLRCTYM